MSTKKLQIIGAVGPTVDATLTQSGQAADAKKTGDELNNINTKIADIDALVGDKSVSAQISDAISTKAGINHIHNEYVNQNAFSNVTVGSTTIAADAATDTLTLVAGSNITLTPDATNDKITIVAQDTVYTHPSSGVTAGTYKSVTVNAQGHVTAGSNPTTLSGYGITDAATKTELNAVSTLVGDTAVSTQIDNAIANKVDKVSGKGLSTNDYTTTEKNKLAGIASGAEVNQNAFSNIAVGSTTIAADAKSDTLTIAAGDNVTITPDATNDKITIAAKDTVYTHPTYTAKSAGLYKVTVDSTGHVSAASAVAKSDITALGIPAQDTTYSAATTSVAGLMSASDKSKLDGIASGANKITVDTALSSSSTNPVQNKVVNTAISNLSTLIGDTAVSEQISDVFDDAITGLSVSGKTITYTKGDGSTGTITTQDTNTTYSSATTSAAGLMSASDKSKLDAITASADAVSFTRSLTSGTKVGTITINGTGTDLYAPTNTDTHYTSKNVVGSSAATSNTTSALTNGNVYLNSVENGAVTSTHKISGSGATTVTTDTNGNIIISSTDNNTTYSAATTSAAGLMSAADKTKLDGIATGANKITVDSALSSTSTNPVQNKVVNTAISNLNTLVGDSSVASQITNAIAGKANTSHTHSDYVNQNAFSNIVVGSTTMSADTATDTLTLVAGSNITLTPDATNDKVTIAATNTVYTHPTTSGNKHIPSGGSSGQILRWSADGTAVWGADNNTTYSAATQSAQGLMSAADKTKLDGIATGANKITVDSALSSSSTNPVQNKVVNTAISNLSTLIGDTAVATQISNAIANLEMPNITYSTTDLVAGESALANGEVYLVYE